MVPPSPRADRRRGYPDDSGAAIPDWGLGSSPSRHRRRDHLRPPLIGRRDRQKSTPEVLSVEAGRRTRRRRRRRFRARLLRAPLCHAVLPWRDACTLPGGGDLEPQRRRRHLSPRWRRLSAAAGVLAVLSACFAIRTPPLRQRLVGPFSAACWPPAKRRQRRRQTAAGLTRGHARRLRRTVDRLPRPHVGHRRSHAEAGAPSAGRAFERRRWTYSPACSACGKPRMPRNGWSSPKVPPLARPPVPGVPKNPGAAAGPDPHCSKREHATVNTPAITTPERDHRRR